MGKPPKKKPAAAAPPPAEAAPPPAPLPLSDVPITRRRTTELQVHPLADQMPALEGADADEFRADVKRRGVQHPLTVQAGGKVLDGRLRLEAAKALGIEEVPVQEVDLSPDEQAACVYRAKLMRQHLSEDQRAVLFAKLLEARVRESRQARAAAAGRQGGRGRKKEEEQRAAEPVARKPRLDEAMSRQFGVSRKKLQRARQLMRECPAKFDRVVRGELTLHKALPGGGAAKGGPFAKPKSPGAAAGLGAPAAETLDDLCNDIERLAKALLDRLLEEDLARLCDLLQGEPAEERADEPADFDRALSAVGCTH